MQMEPRFEGAVDSFEGGVAFGWALDRRAPEHPTGVDLYIDGEFISSVVADRDRADLAVVSPISQKKGFLFDIKPFSQDRLFPRVDLMFHKSLQRVPTNPNASKQLNRPYINTNELNAVGASPWIPVPPASIIRHVTGQAGSFDEMKHSYKESGLINSADLLNLMLDLRLDVEKSNFTVLDIGCGSGRYAPFLMQYLPNCTYLGVDVWKEAIDWAQKMLSEAHPKLRFNLLGEDTGYAGSSFFRLPAPAGSVNVAIAMSLFTHLNQEATEGYFREIRRVLSKDGSAALATFFVLDDASIAAATSAAERRGFELTGGSEVSWYGRDGYLDIFYSEAVIRTLADKVGLEVLSIRRGNWYRQTIAPVTPGAFQDMVLMRPKK
jgi:SAM-dependent methyltransferase